MRGAIVKTVAERNDDSRIMAGDDSSEPTKRGDGVVRRQQHPAHGEAGTFFQMQIGDDEQALLFPEQRAGKIGRERHAADADIRNAHVLVIPENKRACRHVKTCCYPIASLTSSSAASARSSSPASP